MLNKLVMIDWIDSAQHIGWREKKGFLKAKVVLCRTVGYLVGSDKESYKMAATRSEQGDYNDRSSIPKGCVVKKLVLDITLPGLKREEAKKKG